MPKLTNKKKLNERSETRLKNACLCNFLGNTINLPTRSVQVLTTLINEVKYQKNKMTKKIRNTEMYGKTSYLF